MTSQPLKSSLLDTHTYWVIGLYVAILLAATALLFYSSFLNVTRSPAQGTGNSAVVIGSNGLEYDTTTLSVPTGAGDITCVTLKGHGINETVCALTRVD